MNPEGPMAWMNGTWANQADVRLPLDDAMVVHGAGLVEVARTWSGRPVFLGRHIDRFLRAAGEMGLRLPVSGKNDLADLANQYLLKLPPDLSSIDRHIVFLATPGSPGQPLATLVVHGRPLDSRLHQIFRTSGAHLTRSAVGALPSNVIPSHWKHRSRLHWFLAGQQSNGIPVLESANGCITETAIGHVVAVFGTPDQPVLTAPPENLVLPGITLELVRGLAAELGYAWERRLFHWSELASAHEILLVGSGFGVAGVSNLDGLRLNWPGPITRAIQIAFAKRVAMPIQ